METNLSSASVSLRIKAEKLLKSDSSALNANFPYHETRLLIEEFLAHQTALEKQNAELIQTEIEFSKERDYFNDILGGSLTLAPKKGCILVPMAIDDWMVILL